MILVTNAKGGVGKTTVATNLAAALGARDPARRSLIVDLDSNCGSSRSFRCGETEAGSLEGLVGKTPIADLVFRHGETAAASDGAPRLPENVDLLAGCRALDDAESEIRAMDRFFDPTSNFGAKLEAAANEYDYIWLDTGPGMSLATHVAFEVARYCVVVCEPSPRSTEAAATVLEDLDMVRAGRNGCIELLGVVVTKSPAVETRVMRQQLAFLSEGLPSHSGLFPVISQATAIPESQSRYTTIVEEQPTHKVARQFRECAEVLESRLASREKAAA